jgi:23S rRNA (uracil1939-C5)-methyltransferase
MPVARDAVGFFKADSNEVVNCTRCPVSAKPIEVVAEALRRFIRSNQMAAYDRNTGKGLIRHLIVRVACGTGEVMVILVINGKRLPDNQRLIGMMDGAVNELQPYAEGKKYSLESVIINFNTKNTSEILGERCLTAAGKSTIEDTIDDLRFEISPLSFYQVNPIQMKKLYDKVLEYAQLTGSETVLDVYCGIGTIGLFCARKAKRVIGIESVKSAILDATRNAAINAVTNTEYICGHAEDILPKLASEGLIADVVILDPPRAGCKPKLIEAVCKVTPKRIVYVSCDAATLARDVKLLTQMGYCFEEATPVDMFLWTAHVECVALVQ